MISLIYTSSQGDHLLSTKILQLIPYSVFLYRSIRSAPKLYGRTKYADWYFECERVDTSYPLTAVPSSGSYGYITPISEPIFDQNTVTDIVGFNDGKGGRRDWLQFWVAEKEFRVKKADSDHSLIKVSAPACSRSEMELASNALLDALSIRLGRKLRLKALTTVSESVRTDTLFPHGGWGSDGTGMYAPVPFHIESDIPFLRSTTEYFLMDRPRDFIPHVAKFWDSQNQSFNSTCLHLTTAIEGLIDLILDSNLVPNQGVKETLTKQRTLFKKVKADTISAIEKIATEETSAMCTRLRDVIQNVRTKNPPLELLEAAAIVGANIRPDHADGWEKLRNVVAHGGIAGPHDSEQLTHFFGSITVLNALVLGMVGWSGPIQEL